MNHHTEQYQWRARFHPGHPIAKTCTNVFSRGGTRPSTLSPACILFIALSLVITSFADDLSQLYEKAYFLETAKGQTQEALEVYKTIIATNATDGNRQILIQSLQRMLTLHKKQRDKTLQEKVDNFTILPSTLDRIVDTFGEPDSYVGSEKVFTRENLPETGYTMTYANGFSIRISMGKITELGFLEPNFSIRGISIGSTLEEVVAAFPPDEIRDQAESPHVEKGILFTNIYKNGAHSYPTKYGVRFFFTQGKVYGLYLNKDFMPGNNPTRSQEIQQ
ncbi:hypothetical protein PDESU_04527 [Pontiella desulfatans]|uniref:Uncharacterized protein n=1 Tax=Pontiella desulfatans TaxID=2750659 RepID=A0A6C2U784_PONDE|nr:M13 family metallopeptidase [Pontiella desulfatans]VGO15938.1 hypothetical protein PDESU_04527 [Pontiella desulfatans]